MSKEEAPGLLQSPLKPKLSKLRLAGSPGLTSAGIKR